MRNKIDVCNLSVMNPTEPVMGGDKKSNHHKKVSERPDYDVCSIWRLTYEKYMKEADRLQTQAFRFRMKAQNWAKDGPAGRDSYERLAEKREREATQSLANATQALIGEANCRQREEDRQRKASGDSIDEYIGPNNE